MPRIRKLQPSTVSPKLAECFKVLQSGASGECLTGELGCCGDSCCGSALVSRALAEYCQHSDAAREVFVAARGIDALQVALTRGSPSAAAAAARVLGALCGSAHGLRCILRWQSARGDDLLAAVAAVAGGGPELPPDLRAECVDALRSALGALHGPAAGGGMELAAALQANAGVAFTGLAAGGSAAAAAAMSPDLLTRVAVPALLSPNLHLRAAGARLIAATAEEAMMADAADGATAVAAAASTLSAALGLVPDSDSAAALQPQPQTPTHTLIAAEPQSNHHHHHRLPMSALRELVAALLSSRQAAPLLEALRAPSHLVVRCLECLEACHVSAAAATDGSEQEALLDAVLLCAREAHEKIWLGAGEAPQRERRAFVSGAAEIASRLLARGATGPDAHSISTAAALGSSLAFWPQAVLRDRDLEQPLADLTARLCDSALALLPPSRPDTAPAAQRRAGPGVDAPMPQAIPDETERDPGMGLLEDWEGAGVAWGAAHSRGLRAGFGGGAGGGFGCAVGGLGVGAPSEEAAVLRAAAEAAAAAVRLYGAVWCPPSPSFPACGAAGERVDVCEFTAATAAAAAGEGPSRCPGRAPAAPVSQCLGRLVLAARAAPCLAAVALLTGPFEALLQLTDEQLSSLEVTDREVAHTSGEPVDAGPPVSLLHDLGRTALWLVRELLPPQASSPGDILPRGATDVGQQKDYPTGPTSTDFTVAWGWVAAGGGGDGVAWHGPSRGWAAGRRGGHMRPHRPQQQLNSSERHAALLAALRVWARVCHLLPACTRDRALTGMVQEQLQEDGVSGNRQGEEFKGGAAPCAACGIRSLSCLQAVEGAVEQLLAGSERGSTSTAAPCFSVHPEDPRGTPATSAPPSSFLSKPAVPATATSPALVMPVTDNDTLCAALSGRGSASRLMAITEALGYPDVKGDGADTQLLRELICTLGTAVSRAEADGVGFGMCVDATVAPGAWNQLRERVKLLQVCLHTLSTRDVRIRQRAGGPDTGTSSYGVNGSHAEIAEGPFFGGSVGDARDADRAADLADADVILDECLACIAAGLAVS